MSQAPAAVPSELVELASVAAELKIARAKLRAMSLRGEFPALLKVTQKHYLVNRAEVEAWKSNRWTRPALLAAEPAAPVAAAAKTRKRPRKAGAK